MDGNQRTVQARVRQTGQQTGLWWACVNRAAQHQSQRRLEEASHGKMRPASIGLSLGSHHMGKRGKTGAIILRNLQTVRAAMENLGQRHCTVKARGGYRIGFGRGAGARDQDH